jgi:hypothetical protein
MAWAHSGSGRAVSTFLPQPELKNMLITSTQAHLCINNFIFKVANSLVHFGLSKTYLILYLCFGTIYGKILEIRSYENLPQFRTYAVFSGSSSAA